MNRWIGLCILALVLSSTIAGAQADSVGQYLDSAQRATGAASAMRWINKALDAANRIDDPSAQGRSYEALADIQHQERFFALAQKNYTYALKLANNGQWQPYKENKQRLLYKLALSQLESGDADRSVKTSNESFALAGGTKEKITAGRINAKALCTMGKTDEALARLEEVKSMAIAAGLNEELAKTELELGNCLTRMGNRSDANDAYGNAMNISNAAGYSVIGRTAATNMATNFKDTGQPTKAAEVYQEALAVQDSAQTAPLHFELGNALLLSNNVEAAEQAINEGMSRLLFAQKNSPDSLIQTPSTYLQGANAYRNLANELLENQQYAKAIQYYKQYAILQDSAYAMKQRQLNEALSLGAALAERQRTIEQMELERRVADQSIQSLTLEKKIQADKLMTRNVVIGSLAIAILAIGAGVYRVKRMQKARSKAEKLLMLQSLTGQMNPHFIFNALNSVNDFIARNDERAANHYLTSFAQLMRRVLDDSKQTFIPIQEEVHMMKLYLQLEHARFTEAFNYTLDVSPEVLESERLIPPMLVQPFVENAIWHGLRYRQEKGKLTVSIRLEQESLSIVVCDNGIGLEQSAEVKTKQQKKQHSMGVATTKTRIELINELYNTRIGLQVSKAFPTETFPGVMIQLSIPPITSTLPL